MIANELSKDLDGCLEKRRYLTNDISLKHYIIFMLDQSNLQLISEEYDIEHLKNIFDSFTLGDSSLPQTLENPLKLALVNNNIKCESQSI